LNAGSAEDVTDFWLFSRVNGRYDFFFPVDSSQNPMFEAFKTPKDQKRHLLYDGGHGIPRVELIKETLAWLDRFQRASPSPVAR
jgi:hypothetical protein